MADCLKVYYMYVVKWQSFPVIIRAMMFKCSHFLSLYVQWCLSAVISSHYTCDDV